MQNYPGWMGKTEVADFQKANPDVTVKEVEGASGGTAATVNQIRQNEGTYDMTLGGLVIAGHLNAAGLIAEPQLRQHPEHRERSAEVFRDDLPVRHPDRLRQDRLSATARI